MAPKVLEHLKQSRDFNSPEEKAFLMIIRTAENMLYELDQLLKEYGLTQTQYNALRILRGAGEEGLPCNEIGSRMVKRVPDVTRLIDRLEKMGYATRKRLENNRRVVMIRITEQGAALTDKIDNPINTFTKHCFEGLESEQTENLIETMDLLNSEK